ncbi:MAG TPA: hypothetical protein VFE61_17995 [Candidatus Sulfotelmatobacter sp.]|nr:hypothetical protein [Candidatus Sulfotelmatobacter sp.]
MAVDEYYPARLIHYYHRVRSGFQQIFGASLLQPLPLGHVVDDANEVRRTTTRVVHRRYRYLSIPLARGVQ